MSSPAHRFNARVRRLPPCPECQAFEGCPCTTASGQTCAPHRARERILAGEIFVIRAEDARRKRKLRVVTALARTLRRSE